MEEKKILTTVVGSYPTPSCCAVPNWFKQCSEHKEVAEKYEQFMEKCSKESLSQGLAQVVGDLSDVGLDIITDGEYNRENYIMYHCRHLEGIDFEKYTNKSCRNGAYQTMTPTVVGKVEAKDPFLVQDWDAAQKLTSKIVKVAVPGPLTIVDTIANLSYETERELCEDLARVLNVEILRLVQAGATCIQVDEPLYARKPKEAISYGIDLLKIVFQGVDGTKVKRFVHICCGYPRFLDDTEYKKADPMIYMDLAPHLEKSEVIDVISIEDAHRPNDLSRLLPLFPTKTIMFGVIAIASSKIETKDEIKARAQEALKYLPPNRLILSPDCGLGMMPREMALAKLKNLVECVKELNQMD